MAFFSWPSRGSVAAYPADEASIEASEGAIAQFLGYDGFGHAPSSGINEWFGMRTSGLRSGSVNHSGNRIWTSEQPWLSCRCPSPLISPKFGAWLDACRYRNRTRIVSGSRDNSTQPNRSS